MPQNLKWPPSEAPSPDEAPNEERDWYVDHPDWSEADWADACNPNEGSK